MTITIDDNLIKGTKLTPEDIKLELALGLFIDKIVSLGKAASIASISYSQFMEELGKRKIPIHYDVEDLQKDVKTLKTLNLI